MKYQHFSDFDAFSSSIIDANTTMMLDNPKQYSWSICQLDLSEIHVQIGCEGSGNITEGQSLSDGYLFFLPFNNFGAHAANGIILDSSSLVILPPGSEFCIRCKTEHNWSSIFVPPFNLLEDSECVDPSSGSEKMTCRVINSNPQLIKRLRTLLLSITASSSNCLNFQSSPAATSAKNQVKELLHLIIGKRPVLKPRREGRPKFPRQAIINRAKEVLEERKDTIVTIGELVATTKVSERTLRTAFKDYFGVTPIRYLQMRQLHQIYRVLHTANPEDVSVKAVMLQHGVWEFSRFALRYRLIFGELPSQTLRTRRKHRVR